MDRTTKSLILTDTSKIALQNIIKEEIKSLNINYWCECSGVIEHWFKKHQGYPVPNIYVQEILGSRYSIKLEDDEFHYSRIINNEETFTKIMFGFPTKEAAEKVYSEFNNYLLKRNDILKENLWNMENSVIDAIQTIEYFNECYDNGLDSVPEEIIKCIQHAVNILKKDKLKSDSKVSINTIERGQFLLDNLTKMEIINIFRKVG